MYLGLVKRLSGLTHEKFKRGLEYTKQNRMKASKIYTQNKV